MTRDTRRAGAFLAALGGVVMIMTLLAGPAGAQTSGGAVAIDGSVASGQAHAHDDSTASGHSKAVGGSTASGCSTATDESTTSGDDKCARHAAPRPAPTPGRLALTGSWSATMAMGAALAVGLGAILVLAGRRREPAQA